MSTKDHEVFETPDPPSDFTNYDDDQKSEVVHKLASGVHTSYEKFKTKVLDSKDIDFSERIDVPDRHGYRVEPLDYEVSVIEREPETLLQRYQRLKQEITDLVTDIEKIKESQDNSEKLLQVSPADLLQDVEVLQKQLHSVQLDRVLGTEMMVGATHPYHAVLLRDLKAQLVAMKSDSSKHDKTAGGESKQPTYELYTRTEAAKFAHLSKVSELEQRLTQLEALVGSQDTTVSSVAGGLDGEQRDLSSAVLNLQAKVALLDPAHINAIGGQLQSLSALLEQVEEKANAKEIDLGKKTKVTEAIETVSSISALVPLIPDVVERLHTLKDLHERASQFAGCVAYMSDSQHQLSQQITDLQQLLSKVQKSLDETLSSLQTEFTSVESRVNKIQTCKS